MSSTSFPYSALRNLDRSPPLDSVEPAVAVYFGALASQEVVKILTGVFMPMNRAFSHNFRNLPRATPEQIRLRRKVRVFVVGAGAIGCEHLKNLLAMGFRNIVVTDLDKIERSGLFQDFLLHR